MNKQLLPMQLNRNSKAGFKKFIYNLPIYKVKMGPKQYSHEQ
jgi:hypothetical protein